MIKIYKYIILTFYINSTIFCIEGDSFIKINQAQFDSIVVNLESQVWNQSKIVEYNDSIYLEWIEKNKDIDQNLYINELVVWNEKIDYEKSLLLDINNKYKYILNHRPNFNIDIKPSVRSESILSKKDLADIYFNEGYYDDAIIIYYNLIEETINLFGDKSMELLFFYNQVANIFLIKNDIDNAKLYVGKSIALQNSNIVIQQDKFTIPLNILNQIYKVEQDLIGARITDSLINILNTNTDVYIDTIISLPSLAINNVETNRMISEYSNNDLAIELINEAYTYLDNNLYTESAESFLQASNTNAELLDLTYYLNLNFKKYSLNDLDQLYSSFSDIQIADSTNDYSSYYMGLLDYNNNDLIKAQSNFMDYIDIMPNDIKGYQMDAIIHYENGDWFNAIFPLIQSLLIEPGNFDSNLYLCKTLIELNHYHDAYKIITLLLIEKPYHDEANYLLGYTSYLLNDYNRAIKELTNSLLQNSDNYLTYYYLAKAYSKNEKNKKAKESLIKSISINSKFALTHFELAKIYEMIFEDDKAINEYQLAKKYSYNSNLAMDELNYNLGRLYYKNNNYKSAMNPLKEYIKNNLFDLETLEILGQVLMKEERYPEAIDIYYTLLDLEYDNVNYHFSIAESYYFMKDYKNGMIKYEEILLLGEKNDIILLRLGSICNIINQFNQASIYLLDAISCGNVSREILVQLGIAYGGQMKYIQSMQAFKQALEYSLDDPIINYQLGFVYFELEIYDLAIESFLNYSQQFDGDYLGYYFLGQSYFHLEEFDQAIKFFKLATQYNKEHIESIYYIGNCYKNKQEYKLATQYYKLVIKENPDHVLSRVKLADLYSELNKKRELKKECDIIYMLDRDYYNSIIHCNN